MRIAVDAMGGDYAPAEVVAGAVTAATELPKLTEVILVGDETAINSELSKQSSVPAKIKVHHASEVIEMAESPALAVRRKRDSSVGRAVDMVKNGEADAVVSAGNTGAMVVAASLKLRTLAPVERPAIATVMPTNTDPFVLLDSGATTDCSAKLLTQFAVMGSVYSRELLHVERPVVGLLSIGGEATKGNEVTKETLGMLNESKLNFRGNIEGHDLFEGKTDVVVCDGFVGNVVLKTSESAARAVSHLLKGELTRTPIRILGSLLLRGAFAEMKRKVDPESHGGALLLGVNGVCIIGHGTSSRRAIFHAIRVAGESLHQHLNDAIIEELERNGL